MTTETVKVQVTQQGFNVPKRATEGSAGFDLHAGKCVYVAPQQVVVCPTHLRMEFPEGVCGLILPRSGLGSKGIGLANTVGLIDSDYRGEIMLMLYNRNPKGSQPIKIEEGARVAQIMFIKPVIPTLVQTDQVSDTVRGEGGFGSTGVR